MRFGGTVDHILENAPKGELKFALAELSGTVCGAMIANWCRVFSQWQFRTRNVPGMGIIIARLLGVAMLLQALQPGPLDGATFRNPIDPRGQDPWVVQWEGQYLYCWSEGRIKISAARRLQDIASGPATTIWTPPSTGPYSRNIWAPELHHVAGRWYVYFAADDGNNANHRMYVLGSVGSDPFGRYVFRGKISDPSDRGCVY